MTEQIPPADRERVSFAAIVLLLRQMAHQLLQDGRPDEARGLIDGIDAIRAKAQGNLSDDEQKFLDDILYDLHLNAVRGPASRSEESEGQAEPGEAPEPPGSADPSPGGEETG